MYADDVVAAAQVLIAALAGLGAIVFAATLALQRVSGLPSASEILASDTGQDRERLYRSEKLRLSGKPDLIIEERVGLLRQRKLVPVEVKTWESYRLQPSQELQIAGYLALMIEEHGATAVRYGYVAYQNKTFKVRWTRGLAKRLELTIDDVRDVKRRRTASRNHNHPERCDRCIFRDVCEEALV